MSIFSVDKVSVQGLVSNLPLPKSLVDAFVAKAGSWPQTSSNIVQSTGHLIVQDINQVKPVMAYATTTSPITNDATPLSAIATQAKTKLEIAYQNSPHFFVTAIQHVSSDHVTSRHTPLGSVDPEVRSGDGSDTYTVLHDISVGLNAGADFTAAGAVVAGGIAKLPITPQAKAIAAGVGVGLGVASAALKLLSSGFGKLATIFQPEPMTLYIPPGASLAPYADSGFTVTIEILPADFGGG